MTGPSFGVGGIRWGWFVVGALALVLWPAVAQTHTATLLLIWALFALSLGLLWGFAGLLSFGHAAYFGLGAYTYAIASTNIGESTGPLLLAILLPAIVAAVIGAMMFYGRISDVYMGVITLVVTLILFKFMNATAGDAYRIGSARLGGFNGIPAFPILNVPGDPSTQIYGLPFYYLVVVLLLLCYLLSRWILGSFFGRVLIGIRENEARVELLGYSAPLLQDRDLRHLGGNGRPRGLPVRQLGRDRHARRVQLGPVGRGDRVDDRRRPWHAGRPDTGRHRARRVEAAAGPADGDRQLPGARRDPGAGGAAAAARHPAHAAALAPAAHDGRHHQAPGEQRAPPAQHAERCVTDTVLDTRDLSMRFGGVQAVNNVNFSLKERELRCLIGPNGAGKSTFFKCLTGQIRLNHSHGRVFIRGHDVTGWRAYEIVRLGVGIKTQVPSVMNGLSVEENLWLSARRVVGRDAVSGVVADVIEQMSLSGIARRLVGELAHGQRQLVEIGLVLAQKPWLLLLDEPAAGITGAETEALVRIIQQVNQTTTMVVVDHDMEFVRMLGARVTVLHQGAILREGPVDDVLSDALVREVYIGSRAK